MSAQEYNHIVRIVGNDIPGEKKITIGLTQIKGIGYNFATAILDTLKINPNSNVGYLTEPDVQAIEKLITDPSSSNFPQWFLNRRKDVETGNDIHILTSAYIDSNFLWTLDKKLHAIATKMKLSK